MARSDPGAAATQPLQFASAPLIATPVGALAPSASDAVARVQEFYANIKQVDALFRQEVTNNTFGSTKSNDGEV